MQRPKTILAIVLVLWFMALITYELVQSNNAELHGRIHVTPDWFVEMCKWAVASGLAALGVTTYAGWRITRKK